ncbi:MAG: phosphatidate cytidylyltransferase, partial [Desulfobulbaceae bacterium]|nr:phosphatidate cytidylyltransferase [Desulfobulbaceae bacterium]
IVKRLVPGLVMTALWVLILIAGSASLFWLLIVCTAALGLREYYRMTFAGVSGLPRWLFVAVSLVPVLAVLSPLQIFHAALIASLLGSILLVLWLYRRLENGLYYLCCSCLGTVYISLCLAHLVLIRTLPQGVAWLLVLTAVTAGGDTGAYYVGRTLGRRKLCPHISPGKTVEGAIGGIIAGSLCAMVTALVFLPESNPLLILVAAVPLCLFSIAGDLTESVIKRSAGFKDSGTLLFGHGGVLDRIDSLLITGPVLYFLLYFGMLP